MREVTVAPRSSGALLACMILGAALAYAAVSALRSGGSASVPLPLVVAWVAFVGVTFVAGVRSLRQVCVLDGERLWVGRVAGPLRVGRWYRVERPLRVRIREKKLAYRTDSGATSRRYLEVVTRGATLRVGRQSPLPMLKRALDELSVPDGAPSERAHAPAP